MSYNRYTSDVLAHVRMLHVPMTVVQCLRHAERMYAAHVPVASVARMLLVLSADLQVNYSTGDTLVDDLYSIICNHRSRGIKISRLLFARPLTLERKTSDSPMFKSMESFCTADATPWRNSAQARMKHSNPLIPKLFDSAQTLVDGRASPEVLNTVLNSFAAYLNNEAFVTPDEIMRSAFTEINQFVKLSRATVMRIIALASLSAEYGMTTSWRYTWDGARQLNMARAVIELARYLDTTQHEHFEKTIQSLCSAALDTENCQP